MRIVSLLPGATEVVAALGLADHLVGISHECDYPPNVRGKPVLVEAVIDGERASSEEIDCRVRESLQAGRRLYRLNEPRFLEAAPDLIIAQDLCHVCAITPEQLQRAMQALPRAPRLLTLNPTTMEDVLTDIERIGAAAERTTEARQLVADLRARLARIRERASGEPSRPRVACLEWLSPLYAAGHWVPDMVAAAGGSDALGTSGTPSERIAWEALTSMDPDVIVLMPCGFSIARMAREITSFIDRPEWQSLRAWRQGQAYAVEAASYFSRPGPRLVDGVALLAAIFHPTVFGDALPPGVQQLDMLLHATS
jgi:iron complex transport system substrate-binding protein